MRQTHAAIQQTMDHMIAGYKVHDVEMILSSYTQQGAYAAVPDQPTIGTEGLRAIFEQLLASNPEFKFKSTDIVVTGNIALHVSAYEARMPGDDAVHTALSIVVLELQTNGEWLIVIDHPSGERLMKEERNSSWPD
jgi:uncharacterized protein (TIGR02246 family)